MKLTVMTILVLLGSATTALADGIPAIRVTSVSCSSGAPVNFKETVEPGTLVDGALFRNEGGGKILRHVITAKGFEYESGNPPCPTGDTLIIASEQ